MSLVDYSSLQASVANFLHRSDLTAIIPDLITLAETRINGDLDARLQDTKTQIICSPTIEYVGAPSDMINVRHLSVSSTTPIVVLDYMTPDALETAYPWGNSATPQAYTVIGANIYLQPIPDSAYTLDLVYKARVPPLASVLANWLLTTYPNVYLYATLCEAAPYLSDDGRMQVWEAKYTESIQTVNSQDWCSAATMRVKSDVRP